MDLPLSPKVASLAREATLGDKGKSIIMVTRSWWYYNTKTKYNKSAPACWGEHHVDGLLQGRRNSKALAMELRLSCTNSSICKWASTKKYFWIGIESDPLHQDLAPMQLKAIKSMFNNLMSMHIKISVHICISSVRFHVVLVDYSQTYLRAFTSLQSVEAKYTHFHQPVVR